MDAPGAVFYVPPSALREHHYCLGVKQLLGSKHYGPTTATLNPIRFHGWTKMAATTSQRGRSWNRPTFIILKAGSAGVPVSSARAPTTMEVECRSALRRPITDSCRGNTSPAAERRPGYSPTYDSLYLRSRLLLKTKYTTSIRQLPLPGSTGLCQFPRVGLLSALTGKQQHSR